MRARHDQKGQQTIVNITLPSKRGLFPVTGQRGKVSERDQREALTRHCLCQFERRKDRKRETHHKREFRKLSMGAMGESHFQDHVKVSNEVRHVIQKTYEGEGKRR